MMYWQSDIGKHAHELALAAAVITALAVTLVAPPARSAEAIDAWQLVHHDRLDWQLRQHRVAVAKDLAARVRILADIVPAQSEKKAQAVLERRTEVARADARARSRFYLSNDYQHWVLIDRLTAIQSSLDCVVEAREIAVEMACWADVSLAFAKENDIAIALDRLREARMMMREEKVPVKAKDPRIWYADFSRGILAHILTPYLKAQSADIREDAG